MKDIKQTTVKDTYGGVVDVEYQGEEVKLTFNPIRDHYLPAKTVLDTLDTYIDYLHQARVDIAEQYGEEYIDDDSEED